MINRLCVTPAVALADVPDGAGAGIGAFFSPTGYGTDLASGKETRQINGRKYVLEYPLAAGLL